MLCMLLTPLSPSPHLLQDLLYVWPEELDETGAVTEPEVVVSAASGIQLSRSPMVGLLYTNRLQGAPPMLQGFIDKLGTLPEICILVTNRCGQQQQAAKALALLPTAVQPRLGH